MLTSGRVCGWRHVLSEPIDGRWFKLRQTAEDPLRFVGRGDRILTPPANFVHDYGSIPWVAQLALGGPAGHPDHAQHAGKVFPVHDWAYERQAWDDGTPLSRQDADEILATCLDQVECAEWYVRAVYAAVRLGGAHYWNQHRRGACSSYGRG